MTLKTSGRLWRWRPQVAYDVEDLRSKAAQTNGPRCEKRYLWSMRQTNSQLSLRICNAWSEPSLSAWRSLGSLSIFTGRPAKTDLTSSLGSHVIGYISAVATQERWNTDSYMSPLSMPSRKRIKRQSVHNHDALSGEANLLKIFCLPSEKGSTIKEQILFF